MEQLENILLESEEGITFEIIHGENEKLIIRARHQKDEKEKIVFRYNQFDKPIIPKGFERVQGNWDNGFEIRSIESGVSYVWIPVGALPADGTLGTEVLNSKFGTRGNSNEEFSYELRKQFESVKKYGGFYISRRHVKDRYNCYYSHFIPKPENTVITNIDFSAAVSIAHTIEKAEGVKSHLLFGAEYDSAMKFVELYGVNLNEDSTPLQEWTQEGGSKRALRTSREFSSEREFLDTDQSDWNIGFRVALWLK